MTVISSGISTDSAGNTGTGNANAQTDTGNIPEFLKGVDASLASDPSVKNYTNMNDFVKSFIHSQKMVGADKIVVPQKGADEKVWGDVFKKLGLPDSLDKYEVQKAQNSKLDDARFGKLKETLFKQGVLPHQAKGIVDLMEAEEAGLEAALIEQRKQQVSEGLNKLKTEWGAAYDSEVKKAANTAVKVGGKEFIEYLERTGLGDDPQIIKMLAKFGGMIGEKGLTGEGDSGARTPEQLKSRLQQLQSDIKSPYYDAQNPQHTAAKQEVEAIYKALYPDMK